MSPQSVSTRPDPVLRAEQSRGESGEAVYRMVEAAFERASIRGGTLVDVGCGTGRLWRTVRDRFDRCIAADLVRYDDFPPDAEFRQVDLDTGRVDLPDDVADVVAALETIEHLENPRAFVRELVRLARPGGWVAITTPNQLSLLSKLTLVSKNQFNAFQESPGLYPAHLTALLEIDLRRIAAECGLADARVAYSAEGRVPFTGRHYPRVMSELFPRALSDNVLLMARKPHA